MLIDEVKITVKAGDGGAGAVAFNKNMMSLGPVGGSGGRGADVFAEGIADLSALNQFYYKKNIEAANGGAGRGQFLDGKDGSDLVLKVPVGTKFHNLTNSEVQEILKIGERICLAKGGKGGKGNFHFRSSKNTSPREFQPGLPGEFFGYRVELQLIADIGFIGLPNAGKSSLLNELTRANAKVANYKFTTLEPNLGAYYDLVLADIPGLIEGASVGKGLGIKFLRHVQRAGVLFHLVSSESENPERDYGIIRKELGEYHETLLAKKEYLFLSKSDLLEAKRKKECLQILKKLNKNTQAISIHDWDSMEKIKKLLNKLGQSKIVKDNRAVTRKS